MKHAETGVAYTLTKTNAFPSTYLYLK